MKTESSTTLMSVTRSIFSTTGLNVTLMSAVTAWAFPGERPVSATKDNKNVSNVSCLMNAKFLGRMVISLANPDVKAPWRRPFHNKVRSFA
jgi:hypothetical protein